MQGMAQAASEPDQPMSNTLTYRKTPCQMQLSAYRSGGVALALVTSRGLPVATASVNPPEALQPGEIAIKDWAENIGMLELLKAAGVVDAPHRHIPSGFVSIPVCRFHLDIAQTYISTP